MLKVSVHICICELAFRKPCRTFSSLLSKRKEFFGKTDMSFDSALEFQPVIFIIMNCEVHFSEPNIPGIQIKDYSFGV